MSRPSFTRFNSAREPLAVALLYSAAWGLMLFASGRYWDDWAALDLAYGAVRDWSAQQGLFWQLDLLWLLSQLPGTERLGHVLVFALYLVSALCLYGIVSRTPGVGRWERVLIPVLFCLFPVNAARYALVNLMYAASLAVFMFAWLLLLKDLEDPSLRRRLVAWMLLIFAMTSTASLVLFAIVVPAHLLLVGWRRAGDPARKKRVLMQHLPVVLFPALAIALRSLFLSPSGVYAGYNRITFSGMVGGLTLLDDAMTGSFLSPLADAFAANTLVLLLLGAACHLFLKRFAGAATKSSNTREWRGSFAMTLAGLTLSLLGVFPYVAVGKLPRGIGWESRHELLVPLGAALLLLGMVGLVTRLFRLERPVELFLVSLMIGAFILADVKTNMVYQGDWYKQVSIMSRMKEDPYLQGPGYFAYADRTTAFNARKRTYAHYEYNGMTESVFGDATRFGVDKDRAAETDPLLLREHPQYNCAQYDPDSPRYRVTITRGTKNVLKPGVLFGLWTKELFAPERFRQDVHDVVRLRTEPSDAEGSR